MPVPVLLVVAGTRSEMLASCSLLEAMRAAPRYSLPFQSRLLITGQEDTELHQTLGALGIEPDEDLGVKTSRLADAALAARLLVEVEAGVRHQGAAAVLVAGYSASAWAAAVAAYFKELPLIHLGAGQLPPRDAPRPFPEWLHAQNLTRLTHLHLCPDRASAEAVRAELDLPEEEPEQATRIETVGSGADEVLARSLASPPPGEEDPTLEGLRPGAGRVLVFIRRREHHADALRPLCRALDALSTRHAGEEFIVVLSLQSHICDALKAMLPQRANLHLVSPLPHPAFVREAARARLVVTDSAGAAREALLLGRDLVLVGRCSLTQPLEALASESARRFAVAPMVREALESAIAQALARPALPVAMVGQAPPYKALIDPPPAGRRALEIILEWWKEREAARP